MGPSFSVFPSIFLLYLGLVDRHQKADLFGYFLR